MTTILYFFWDGFGGAAADTVDGVPCLVGQLYMPGIQRGDTFKLGTQKGQKYAIGVQVGGKVCDD